MQIETIGKCISAGLHFSIVTGDIWYFTKDMVKYLDEKKLDWVFQSKGNRKIKIRGRWTTLEEIDLSYTDSRTFTISGNTYSVWEIEGRVKGIGSVKAIISEGISGRRYYVTNRRNWKASLYFSRSSKTICGDENMGFPYNRQMYDNILTLWKY